MAIVTFIGAGSVTFSRDLVADLLAFDELADLTLHLHDIDAERLATAEAVSHNVAAQRSAQPTIRAFQDRRAALEGADFVINMVQIGGLESTRTDFEVPSRFGVSQTIADTLGIGGVFRGLRTFPFLRDLTADMREMCPDALLLNYTNPMAMNVWFLSQVAPDIKAYGLCHSVHWTVVGLSEVLGIDPREVSFDSAGVNHQAWLLRLEHEGRDLYPALDARIAADPELRRRVRVDMYKRIGFYPTETSEHSSEYTGWYLKSSAEIERLRINVGEYVGISEENVAEFEHTKELLRAGGPIPLEEGNAAEYAPQVIHSVVTGTPRKIQVNVANTGLITNLPDGAGVEVPATVDEMGVHPWHVGDLPPQCGALNRNFLNVAELTVHAALTEDPRAIRQAAMLDPALITQLTVNQIWELCDELVTAHKAVLPEWATVRLGVPNGA